MGDNCVIGHCTEVKNSILMNHVEAGHFNYIGDSILGSFVNMGAGSRLANVQFRRLEEKMIFLPSGKKYGPKFAALLFVICFLFEPSEFIVQICSAMGRIELSLSRSL